MAAPVVTVGRGHGTHLTDGRPFPASRTLCGRPWDGEYPPETRVTCLQCKRNARTVATTVRLLGQVDR